MKKYILILFILFLPKANAFDLYAENNEFFVPEQWGFRSGYTLKESYLMDMKPRWEQTKKEWTFSQKPVQSNWKNAVTEPIIYSNQFKIFRIPRKLLER